MSSLGQEFKEAMDAATVGSSRALDVLVNGEAADLSTDEILAIALRRQAVIEKFLAYVAFEVDKFTGDFDG